MENSIYRALVHYDIPCTAFKLHRQASGSVMLFQVTRVGLLRIVLAIPALSRDARVSSFVCAQQCTYLYRCVTRKVQTGHVLYCMIWYKVVCTLVLFVFFLAEDEICSTFLDFSHLLLPFLSKMSSVDGLVLTRQGVFGLTM